MEIDQTILSVAKELKSMCEASNAGKATLKAEGSEKLNGWTIGITVQRPGFKPERGDWKL